MYSTCLFCNSDLGKNEAIEHFPVGLRLSYARRRDGCGSSFAGVAVNSQRRRAMGAIEEANALS